MKKRSGFRMHLPGLQSDEVFVLGPAMEARLWPSWVSTFPAKALRPSDCTKRRHLSFAPFVTFEVGRWPKGLKRR